MPRKHTETIQRPFARGIWGLVFLNLLMFGDVLFNSDGRVLSSSQADLYLHFVAWRQFAFDQLRQGHLVLWNPHYLCGAPFLGNFESALLYPLNWLYLFLPQTLAINGGIVLHVFLSGFFVYLWAHHRGLHPMASFAAGSLFMFGGAFFLHLYAGHLPNLCTMAWIPLIFLAVDGLIEKAAPQWVLLGIFAVSMQILAGHPQYVYFTAIIVTLYTAMNLLGNKNKLRILGALTAVYGGAFFLTAAQLWTGLQAASECGRKIPLEYSSAGSFSFPPQNLITLILPDFFGNLSSVHYWSQWFLWEVSLFIGITAFLLVLIAIVCAPKEKWRWPLATAAGALFLAFGAYTPFYRLVYEYAPLFKGLRGICKFDIFVSLFLALLAGIGLDHILKNKGAPRWFAKTLLGGGGVLIGLGLLIFHSVQVGPQGSWTRWFTSVHWLENRLRLMDPSQMGEYCRQAGLHSAASLWTGGATCLLLFLLATFQKKDRGIAYPITALLVLELFLFARSNRPTFELSLLREKFAGMKRCYDRDAGDYRVYGTASGSLVTGKCDIWEDEPMILGRYGRFVCYSQGIPENKLFSVLPIFQRFHPVFGMMRLKYRVREEQEGFRFYPMPFKPLPRMILLNEWEVKPDAREILPALFDPKFDPARKVYLEKDPGLVPVPRKTRGEVQWEDLSTERILINADVPQDCVLLITDNYSDGWHAVGLPGSGSSGYQVVPGNYFLRAVPLKEGKHHFILEYRPWVFVAGKWVSILSCLAYVGILVLYLRRRPTLN